MFGDFNGVSRPDRTLQLRWVRGRCSFPELGLLSPDWNVEDEFRLPLGMVVRGKREGRRFECIAAGAFVNFVVACAMIFAFCPSNSYARRNTFGYYSHSLYSHSAPTWMCRANSVATPMAATPPATSPATPSGAPHKQLYPLPHVRQPQAVTTITMLPIFSDYNSVM
jgi:hypothetical protein